jgi:hypothetical protein
MVLSCPWRSARESTTGEDQRGLTKFCDERDLPIDRIAPAVQPTPAHRAALDELKDASVKAAEGLKTPTTKC